MRGRVGRKEGRKETSVAHSTPAHGPPRRGREDGTSLSQRPEALLGISRFLRGTSVGGGQPACRFISAHYEAEPE
jgi:hypothetical protein